MKVLSLILAYFLGICVCSHGQILHFAHIDRWTIINYHNSLRSEVPASNMLEMSWDRVAAHEARRRSRTCDFQASRLVGYSQTAYYRSSKTGELPIDVMVDAMKYWVNNKTENIQRDCRIDRSCDYRKMITADVEGVGCAVARCSVLNFGGNRQERDVNFVTCFYVPFIDIEISPPYIPGASCSRCRTGYSCSINLCTPPRIPVGNLEFGKDFDSKMAKVTTPAPRRTTRRPPIRWTTNLPAPRRTTPEVKFVTTMTNTQKPPVDKPFCINPDHRHVELQGRTISNRYFDNRGHLRVNPVNPVNTVSRHRPSRIQQRVKRQARYEPSRRRRPVRTRQQERLLRQRQQRERHRRMEERRRQQERLRRRHEQARLTQSGSLSENDKFYLLQMHNSIRQAGQQKLQWSSQLEVWAKYVIRCDIQYPGPRDCYTNFGKIDVTRPVYTIVYDWSRDTAVYKRGRDCRTPEDRTSCNRNLNMKRREIRDMGCASISCGREKQVTCIYQ